MRKTQFLLTSLHDAGQVNVGHNALNGKNFPSAPITPANNRRTDKPTALPWGFTLISFGAEIRTVCSESRVLQRGAYPRRFVLSPNGAKYKILEHRPRERYIQCAKP